MTRFKVLFLTISRMYPFIRTLESADQAVTLEINSMHSPFTDHMWALFSDRELWYPLYVAIAAFLVWKLGWKRGLVVILGVVLTILACDQFSNLIKDAVARLRPSSDQGMLARGLHVIERPSRSFSFFSAHSANAMGLASCTFTALRSLMRVRFLGYGVLMYVWGGLVSVSRVFVGKHFLGDVLVGVTVGIVFGVLIAKGCRYLISRCRCLS